jgi:hypothetical protein
MQKCKKNSFHKKKPNPDPEYGENGRVLDLSRLKAFQYAASELVS